jgi:pimeloyl-ACP methyl ester carboxylesterase
MPGPIKEVTKVAEKIASSGKVSSQYFEHGSSRIHYMARGDRNKPVIAFLHGTPGTWDIFAHQLNDDNLVKKAYLVSIDRPGWGKSSASANDIYLSLKTQADLLAPLLLSLKNNSNSHTLILAGHSLGATLASYIAMLYPDIIDGTVSFAGDLSGDYLDKQWYNEVASWWLVKPLLPQMITNSNNEVLALPANLTRMSALWSELNSPYIVYQGGEDSLVDYRNADFARQLNTRSSVEVNFYPEQDHFIHLVLQASVSERLLQLLDSVIRQ